MPKFIEVNKNFFKKWTSEMAYVLGFFTADGCLTINPRGSHYIEFVNNDLDVLEKIKRAMKSGHKIGKRIRPEKNCKDTYRIQIGRKEMFKDLQNLGFLINKTTDVTLPKIPSNLFVDYLRGFFDGDGWISYGSYNYKDRKNKKFQISIKFVCYNKYFLIDLAKAIKQNIKIQKGSLFKIENVYNLGYSTLDSLQIINAFYKNKKAIWMDRKYNSCKKAINTYNKLHGGVA